MLSKNTIGGLSTVLLTSWMTSAPVHAEVVKASPDHYILSHEANTSANPDAVWQRLVNPSEWWLPDHTYSLDSNNLRLELSAGGLWSETWEGGSVVHGTVLLAQPERILRLNAPFGPLQGMGVSVTWTIELEALQTEDETTAGSLIRFTEVANGSMQSGLDKLAPAVDYVKQQAIMSLAEWEQSD